MFIFSKNGETVVNSDNSKNLYVMESSGTYNVCIDGVYLAGYSIKDDAVKELNEIIRQIESGATRYDLR